MVADIFIIIGKVLWFVFEVAFAGLACPIFLILDLGDTPEATARLLHDFLTMGTPFWSAAIVFLYIKNPKGFRDGFTNLIARIHYLFVRHPATEVLKRADLDDPYSLQEAVNAFNEIPVEAPPLYKSENMGRKAQAHAERMPMSPQGRQA